MSVGHEYPGVPDMDIYRIWDWSALIGACSGVAAAVVWYLVDNGRQEPPTDAASGLHLAIDVPSTVAWLPFILGFVFGGAGLGLQKSLTNGNLLNKHGTQTSLLILGCAAGGVATSLAFWIVPQQLVYQDTVGHRTSLPSSPITLVILPALGLVIGVVLAARQTQTAPAIKTRLTAVFDRQSS